MERLLEELAPRLVTVARWQDGWVNLYMRKENVLEHVRGMIELFDSILGICPTLAASCRVDDVRAMIVLHDLGEVVVGDTPRTTCNGEGAEAYAERKRREQEAVLCLITEMLPWDSERFRGLYMRVAHRTHDDVESWLTKLMDIAQGTGFGARYVFPIRAPLGVGHERCGDTLAPEYFVRLLDSVAQSLSRRGYMTPVLGLELLQAMDATLFRYLKTYRNAETVDGIRAAFEDTLSACQTAT